MKKPRLTGGLARYGCGALWLAGAGSRPALAAPTTDAAVAAPLWDPAWSLVISVVVVAAGLLLLLLRSFRPSRRTFRR